MPDDLPPETRPYPRGMGRPLTKPRPKQGARIAAFRRAAGLSQAELADAVGVQQQTIAFWELSDKPPRSDVLPKMAKTLGVRVEDLLGDTPVNAVRKPGPAGKLQKALELAQKLPKREQDLVLQFVETLVSQRRKAS